MTLDIVSKGRIALGVGLGYQEADFKAFGVPMNERVGRFEESVENHQEVLDRRALYPPRQAIFHLDEVQVLPKPYTQPAPPLWIRRKQQGGRRTGRPAGGHLRGKLQRRHGG